jgi:hypothetical protein
VSATGRWRWLDASEWDAIVGASPGATGFHSRGWSLALAGLDARYESRCLGVELEGRGEVVALPLLVRRGLLRNGLLGRAFASSSSVYGGPVAAGRHLEERDWERFLDALGSFPLGRIECYGNPHEPLPEAWAPRFKTRRSSTHVIGLAELGSDVVESFTSACRRNVRKARREGVTVERLAGERAIDEYVAIYADTLRRWGKPAEEGHGEEQMRAWAKAPCVELWGAREPGGRLAAAGFFLFARSVCVYWHGAMLEELAALRPANALHASLIEEARRRGCERYDFNPSGGLRGVEEFKESFSAERVEVLGWRHRHPWVAALDRGGA